METQSSVDTDIPGRRYFATFLVEHARGRFVTGVRADVDFDADDSTSSAPIRSVTSQFYGVGGTNLLETSRVTVAFDPGTPGGLSCAVTGGGVRRRDVPVRIRVVDSVGDQSQAVRADLHVVAGAQGLGCEDFPHLRATSQTPPEITPQQTVTYSFVCQDPDITGATDQCERANIRWRRLNDGETSAVTLKTGMLDDVNQVHTMSFPSRGYYVVEAQLGNEDGSFPDTGNPSGGWWRLGNAVVNGGFGSLSASLAFSGASPSSPPSVNAGATVSALATVADAGGTVQVAEWDGTNDGSFERREYTVPAKVGGDIVHPELTLAQRTQAVGTSTPGVRSVALRVTDNGALDAADTIRRQLTVLGQLRVNAIPTAGNVARTTPEDTPVTIPLAGSDSDGQPEPLTYEIVTAPPASAGTLGSLAGNEVTFTPAPDFHGTTSFTYRVRDGGPSIEAAWAYSSTATVTVTVSSVNDPPVAGDLALSTIENTPITVGLPASDADGDALTFAVETPPGNGTASITGNQVRYVPAPGFRGTDTFTFRASDPTGDVSVGEVTVTVRALPPPPPTTTIVGDWPGGVTVAPGESVQITGARVTGPVTIQPGGALVVVNSRLTGGITADNPSFLSLCGTDVSASPSGQALAVSNADVPLRIGDPATGCAGNRFAGRVTLTGNFGTTFGANAVSANVTITGGGPSHTVVKANQFLGSLACSGNNPPPTNVGQPNTAASKSGQCAAL